MTYHEDFTLPREITELVNDNGFDILPELLRLIFNTAMEVEREPYLGAAPYQRSPERRGHANGFKPKTVQTRVGDIQFDIPQVRSGDFYPSALEKGLRSERALHLALAEMYLQGVSTRKVSALFQTEGLSNCAVRTCPRPRSAVPPSCWMRRSKPGAPGL